MGIVLDGWSLRAEPSFAPGGGAVRVHLDLVGQELLRPLVLGAKVDRVSGRIHRPAWNRVSFRGDVVSDAEGPLRLDLGEDRAGRPLALEARLVVH